MATVSEPRGIGALVNARPLEGGVRQLIRVLSGRWQDANLSEFNWVDLDQVVIITHGYIPPVEEPTGWGAVVQDAHGVTWAYVCGTMLSPWRSRQLVANRFVDRPWKDISQPVEVLYRGVE